MKTSKLIDFLISLGTDVLALRRYQQDRDAAMNEAGLSPEEKALLTGGDQQQLKAAIAAAGEASGLAPGFMRPSPTPSPDFMQPSPTVSVAPGFMQPSPTVAPGFMQPSPTVSVAPGFMQPSPTVAPGFMQPSPTVAPGFMQPSPYASSPAAK